MSVHRSGKISQKSNLCGRSVFLDALASLDLIIWSCQKVSEQYFFELAHRQNLLDYFKEAAHSLNELPIELFGRDKKPDMLNH